MGELRELLVQNGGGNAMESSGIKLGTAISSYPYLSLSLPSLSLSYVCTLSSFVVILCREEDFHSHGASAEERREQRREKESEKDEGHGLDRAE